MNVRIGIFLNFDDDDDELVALAEKIADLLVEEGYSNDTEDEDAPLMSTIFIRDFASADEVSTSFENEVAFGTRALIPISKQQGVEA